jgi:hypothetical protein
MISTILKSTKLEAKTGFLLLDFLSKLINGPFMVQVFNDKWPYVEPPIPIDVISIPNLSEYSTEDNNEI